MRDRTEYFKQWRQEHRVKRAEYQRAFRAKQAGLKFCPDCNEERPVAEFRLNASCKSGLSVYCKQHQYAREKKSREANPKTPPPQQVDMFKPVVKKSCNCHQYTTCMICRNTEKRRAFRAGELPVYRVPMIAAAIAATD
jgi:hypothetical protein